jgi:phosphotransferase system HPr-like phosphotransfer protein
MTEPFPEVRIERRYTLMKAVVSTEEGFGTLRGMARFVMECQKYKGQIILTTPEEKFEVDCKTILGLAMACSPPGTTLEFKVEGTDEEAARVARRLYSAVTSKSIYEMDFDRYEKKEGSDKA